MARKRDIRQMESIAREFAMDDEERREFGDDVEAMKQMGHRGSGADGDFSYEELRDLARDFQGENQ